MAETVLLPAVMLKPFTPAPAEAPLSSISGVPLKPGWVVPSIRTAPEMVGRADSTLIV